MLYDKSKSEKLEAGLFENPTAEFRGAPFWAWNDKLEKDELLRQIDIFKEMGLGGFHMHVRCGLQTPYLGEEFMDLISACVDKAKHERMLAYLYDEDRWPSGAAGGFVTEDPRYRIKHIDFTVHEDEEVTARSAYSAYAFGAYDGSEKEPIPARCGWEAGKSYLLAAYDVVLKEDGRLKSYRKILPEESAVGTKWYAYVRIGKNSGWYNGYTYIDTLSEEAARRFVDVTYEAYYKKVGAEFGKTIPSIFTDEPQYFRGTPLPFSQSKKDASAVWTTDFPVTFYRKYGYDITEKLPELFFEPDGAPSRARYHFYDHAADRFTGGFIKTCGDWTKEHGIAFTGHLLFEDSLERQTQAVGETMRAYPHFGIPGMDLLCERMEFSTAKQVQSVVHQYGKEGMLSELYGVTGWDYDFRGHKFQGDWQACLGVTLRVQHLAWYSMRGSAKRDYPASISYQSAWHRQYGYVEDHFARVNTVLTRGRPKVRIGVVFPIESFWLHRGPNDLTADQRGAIEANFQNIISWLLRGTLDFDFIDESLLPELYEASDDASLHVGKMQYEAVILPAMETIRQTTLGILKDFRARGGKVVIAGDAPSLVDAAPSPEAAAFAGICDACEYTAVSICRALEDRRDVEIRYASGERAGERTTSFIYQMREDADCDWLFLARVDKKVTRDYRPDETEGEPLFITLKGRKHVEIYDTVTGKIFPAEYEWIGKNTRVFRTLYASDSLLLRISGEKPARKTKAAAKAGKPVRTLDVKEGVRYELSEPNVMVLDLAEWSEDGAIYQPKEEILRIDRALRLRKGYPMADGRDVQPWRIAGSTEQESVFLRFRFQSELTVPVSLAAEGAEQILLNGEQVPVVTDGWYVDRHILRFRLPDLKKGTNELILKLPFGKRTSLENVFLLGNFGVRVRGSEADIVKKPKTVSFGDAAAQGLPFYGAALTYEIPFSLEKKSDLVVAAPYYRGALIEVKLDGEPAGKIVYAPYRLPIGGVHRGKHKLSLTVYLSRVNSFSGLHTCADISYIGPNFWYEQGDRWAYEYQLKKTGILKSPTIEIYQKP